MKLNNKINLVICQKSKIDDWVEHFKEHYRIKVYDLTRKKQLAEFHGLTQGERFYAVGVINYELSFRRSELTDLSNFTLILDESSLIQNENSKRSKFILKKLKPENVILLSGTLCGGKYEKLWSQLHLLGWKISKELFYRTFVKFHYDYRQGFPLMMIDGYKNEERLKRKMREYGCVFMKTQEVINLPEQIHQTIKIPTTKDYIKFRKSGICTVDGKDFIGDTTLTKMLYERQLCGCYNKVKLDAFQDTVDSTEDRLIVFYNFHAELDKLLKLVDRPVSMVNGQNKDLSAYETMENSITFIQYQAGAMGLNLQKANRNIYFTPPLSSELFEQSKKRTHRVVQNKPCFYYYLTCEDSIEEQIYKMLEMRKDYTDALFKMEAIQ